MKRALPPPIKKGRLDDLLHVGDFKFISTTLLSASNTARTVARTNFPGLSLSNLRMHRAVLELLPFFRLRGLVAWWDLSPGSQTISYQEK